MAMMSAMAEDERLRIIKRTHEGRLIVMASFLHAAPSGLRFSGQELGAWYVSASASGPEAGGGSSRMREKARLASL
jgi:hypothetical protein